MALFVNNKTTYRYEVEDPDTGEKYHYKLKKLDEGAVQDRSDLVTRVRMGGGGKASRAQRRLAKKNGKAAQNVKAGGDEALYLIGEVRRFDLLHSLVSWNFVDEEGHAVPINEDTIRVLDAGIAEDIMSEINALNPRVFGGVDDDDEDDDDDLDNDNDDDDDEPVDPTSTTSVTKREPGSEVT